MECPKCQFENPSGIRYCLHCGAQMLPPVPKKRKTQEKPRKIPSKSWLLGATLITVSFFGLLAIVVMGLQGHRSSNDPLFSETAQGIDTKKALTTQEARTNYEYVDLTTHTLSIPDSTLKIEFPAYSICRYDYDPENQQLIFEIETFDGLTITFTSSKLNATPYTKSEAEASLKTGLYHEIAGEEDEYYYILPSNGPTATATIVDCAHNRSTNITVYDDHYISENEEEASFETPELLSEDSSQETALIESSSLEESEQKSLGVEDIQESMEALPSQEALEIQESSNQTSSIDQDTTTNSKNYRLQSSSQTGSQKAVNALEGLLSSTKLND